MKTACLRVRDVCPKLASTKKSLQGEVRVFVNRSLAAESHREPGFVYDASASGQSLYAYVQNNPVNFIDPLGLEMQFTIGVGGSFGGSPFIVTPGIFGGGGMSIGFTSSGQLIIQFQATGSVGVGAYGGVGVQGGISKTKCATESGVSVQQTLQGDFNFGAGPSVGGSVQYDGNGGGGFQAGVGHVGVGYGVQVSGGVTQTVTIATPALFSNDSPCECK